jgi:hypothetical protein
MLAKNVLAVDLVAIDDGELRVRGSPLMVKDRRIADRLLEGRQLVDLFALSFAGPTADTERGVVQQPVPLIRDPEV